MQKTIVNITSDLLSRLPAKQMYFTTSDLLDAGFPAYLVDRIHLEIEGNLAESVQLPQSDWADMQTDAVQDAWSNFLGAIRAETRLPSSYARSVIETSVEDLIDLLSNPRLYIISTLFRSNKTASLDELLLRSRWIIIYPHLTNALVRYMQKKQLVVISRDKALYVISQVDDRLTEGFTPLKWGQHLENLFGLLKNEVPSELLASFFEDRGMESESRALKKISQTLSRNSFIDVLTGMSILDLEEEDIQSDRITWNSDVPADKNNTETHFDHVIKTPASETEFTTKDSDLDSTQTEYDRPISLEEAFRSMSDDPEEQEISAPNEFAGLAQDELPNPTTNDLAGTASAEISIQGPSKFTNPTPSKQAGPESNESPEPIEPTESTESTESTDDNFSPFGIQSEEVDPDQEPEVSTTPHSGSLYAVNTDEDIAEPEDRPKSILDAYLEIADNVESIDEDEKPNIVGASASDADHRKGPMSFNDTQDMDEPDFIYAINNGQETEPTQFEREDGEHNNEPAYFGKAVDEHNDEPIYLRNTVDRHDVEPVDVHNTIDEHDDEPALIDASHDDDEDIVIYLTSESKKLLSYLEPNLDLFIVEIFLNDELEFYKHLENISSYNNWRMAGRYITRDIFDRNRIDLYSETAVLFTDTVQEYFDQLEH